MMFKKFWVNVAFALLLFSLGLPAISGGIRCHSVSITDIPALFTCFTTKADVAITISQSDFSDQDLEETKRANNEERADDETRNGKDMRKFYIRLLLLKATS